MIDDNKKEQKETLNTKTTTEEDKMGLLGRGKGYLGLPKKQNKTIRYVIIWILTIGLSIYFSSSRQDPMVILITIGLGIMFSIFNSRT
jgi:hypothetical protein